MLKKQYKAVILLFIYILSGYSLSAQSVKGNVFEYGSNQKLSPLPFANVYWMSTTHGTTTDKNGHFELSRSNPDWTKLIVSFVGYQNDTIVIREIDKDVKIVLVNSKTLPVVEIKEQLEGAYISMLKPIQTQVITTAGLQKLACCNLSESFMNNATVDVGYTDAVSGAKQIQMLGLAGIYSQLLWENMPFLRGQASSFGLTYIPGSWMESIQISKGTSSVVNGFESVTGQINIEYKKPQKAQPLFLNVYTNSELKQELNVLTGGKLNEKLSTMLMAHGSYLGKKWDNNNDGFMDIPKQAQINLFNRWSYDAHNYHSINGINFVYEDRKGGQMNFNEDQDKGDTLYYGLGIKNKRVQVFTKNGFIIPAIEGTSLGIQASASYHEQDAFFGPTTYKGTQKSAYINAIWESQPAKNHKYNLGLSYQYDNYEQTYQKLKNNQSVDTLYNMPRTESVPGIFAQYTFDIPEKFTLILGARYDMNSYYRSFFTPRLHIKYNISKNSVLRASAGKGYRSANIFAENIGYMASARKFMIVDKLDLEEAWNYGINFTQTFTLKDSRKATLTLDYYRTEFINQVVVDIDHMMHHVDFYNLGFKNTGGKSYSNSLQAEFTIEPFKRFTLTLAGRMNDVKVDYLNGTFEKPFVSKYKGLLTMSYATKFEKWMFDFTIQYNSKTRLPNIVMAPAAPVYDNYSPDYLFMLGQITRKFKHFDVYMGVENLGNYMQHMPIMSADKPFSSKFDASMIWGPLMGRMVYAGFRFEIK